MDKERLRYLIDAYRARRATDQELSELETWYRTFAPGADQLPDNNEDKSARRHRIWKQITASLDNLPTAEDDTANPSPIRFRRLTFARVAAVWAAFATIGLAIYLLYMQPPATSVDTDDYVLLDNIRPGGDQATLTLSDGSVIDLTTLPEDGLHTEQGVTVAKTESGLITSYAGANDQSSMHYTVQTPRGGQYRVVLPDGSAVWLNAASSLRYPAQFSSSERRVELRGEAYFEIRKSADGHLPFIVETPDQEVEVLGTTFNIRAYADKSSITTLLSGKVMVTGRLHGANGEAQQLSVKGHETSWKNGRLHLATVDPGYSIAWKNGKFSFSGENIREIMDDIARWYDVEVIYRGDLSNVNFIGSISKYETIGDVLRKLELTGTVSFKIAPAGNERRIIVMP